MRMLHYEKNFHYSDRELLLAARKLGKLATYCKRLKNEDSTIKVEVEKRETKKTSDEIKVTIIIELPGKTLVADSRKATFIEAFDRCEEKLATQVVKYKEKQLGAKLSAKRAK